MARIDHTACNHPKTPKARAACRSLRANLAAAIDPTAVVTSVSAVDYVGDHIRKVAANYAMKARMDRASDTCTRKGTHCENCGNDDYESINLGDQGYSACCNELVTDPTFCRNHHG